MKVSEDAGRHHLVKGTFTAVIRIVSALCRALQKGVITWSWEIWISERLAGHSPAHGSARNELSHCRQESHLSFPWIFALFQPQFLIYSLQMIQLFFFFFVLCLTAWHNCICCSLNATYHKHFRTEVYKYSFLCSKSLNLNDFERFRKLQRA